MPLKCPPPRPPRESLLLPRPLPLFGHLPPPLPPLELFSSYWFDCSTGAAAGGGGGGGGGKLKELIESSRRRRLAKS